LRRKKEERRAGKHEKAQIWKMETKVLGKMEKKEEERRAEKHEKGRIWKTETKVLGKMENKSVEVWRQLSFVLFLDFGASRCL